MLVCCLLFGFGFSNNTQFSFPEVVLQRLEVTTNGIPSFTMERIIIVQHPVLKKSPFLHRTVSFSRAAGISMPPHPDTSPRVSHFLVLNHTTFDILLKYPVSIFSCQVNLGIFHGISLDVKVEGLSRVFLGHFAPTTKLQTCHVCFIPFQKIKFYNLDSRIQVSVDCFSVLI